MNFRQKHLNHELKKTGFGGIDDPQLIHQLAFCVRDHEHFRKVLLAVETGEKRKIAYDVMRPHLNFEAHPLDWYIMKGQEEAEELQLPVKLQDGSIVAYKDYHGEQPALEVLAEKAIKQNYQEKLAKGSLELVCARCRMQEFFPGLDRLGAFSFAAKSGWKFRPDADGNEESICPGCSEFLAVGHA
jgi:hypothetical protein